MLVRKKTVKSKLIPKRWQDIIQFAIFFNQSRLMKYTATAHHNLYYFDTSVWDPIVFNTMSKITQILTLVAGKGTQ